MPRSQEEINARRQRKTQQRGKNLTGYGLGESRVKPRPFLHANDVTGHKIVFPSRDLDEKNNYTEAMWALIRDHFKGEPKVAVEVGTRRGGFAAGLMENTENTKIFCIDTWGGRSGRGDLASWFSRMEKWAFRRAFPMHGASMFWGGLFPYKFDLVFIDAASNPVDLKRDYNTWWNLLSAGGLLIGQHYNHKDVRITANEVFVDVETKGLGPRRAHAFWVKK